MAIHTLSVRLSHSLLFCGSNPLVPFQRLSRSETLHMLTLYVCLADRVYGPDEGTEELYTQTASDIIKSALEGMNGASFDMTGAPPVYGLLSTLTV